MAHRKPILTAMG